MMPLWNPDRFCAALALLLLATGACRPAASSDATGTSPRWLPVERRNIRQTVPFQGELEARNMMQIAVGLQGSAVLAELAPEGTRVRKGDVLARFDSAQIEQDLARQENECVRTRQELESLEKAELPLELLDLESQRADLLAELEAETSFLDTAQDLASRGLMSDTEVLRQREKLAALQVKADRAATRLRLTSEHLHAARLAKARAALEAAERQRDFTARQLALCEIRAPADGTVSHVPLPVGGEYRTAHVGDSLFRNQVFLCLPQDADFVVRGYVEESALPSIRPGAPAVATPAAFPDLRLPGRVESVGAMARTRPGQPLWRKYFPVAISLDPLPRELPAGLTVHVEITAGEATDALAVPRAALEDHEGRLWVERRLPSGAAAPAEVEIGWTDSEYAEIRSGLSEGDLVRCP
jgi:multidrug resistance efflux pump